MRYETYSGDDPIAYVVSRNLHRRHLDENQRAMVAANIAELTQGRPEKAAYGPVIPTQAEAAEMLNVGERSVRRARVVSRSKAVIAKQR